MKIVLIILLVFYLLILLTRYIAPILLRYFLKKIGDKYGIATPPKDTTYEQSTSAQKGPPKFKEKVGEYIDFEEID